MKKYRVDYVLHIDVEAESEMMAYAHADLAITAFDLTQDIDAVVGCGDVGDAHAWVHSIPLTITHLGVT